MSKAFEGPLTSGQIQGRPVQPDLPALDSPSGQLRPAAQAVRPAAARARMRSIANSRSSRACTDRLPGRAPVSACAPTTRWSDRGSTSWAWSTGRTIWDGAMPGADPEERRAIYEAMIDTLAAAAQYRCGGRRAVRIRQAGQLLRPPGRSLDQAVPARRNRDDARDGAADRVAARHPARTDAHQRGPRRLPHRQHDLCARTAPKCCAVLDWELSTLGDPLADFTYLCMAWVTENGGRSGVWTSTARRSAFPNSTKLVERYCAATGRDGRARHELVSSPTTSSASRASSRASRSG